MSGTESVSTTVAACAALLRDCRARRRDGDPKQALRAALAVANCARAPPNLALQAHVQAAELLYEHTEEVGMAVQQLRTALGRCDGAPATVTTPVLCAAACVLQGLIQRGELELAGQLLEPLLAVLLQQRTDAADASVDPLPLLASHVRVLQVVLLDAEGRLGAAAASLPAVREAAQALKATPAAPDAPHAGWAQAGTLLRLLTLLEAALLWRRGELGEAEQCCAAALAEAEEGAPAGGKAAKAAKSSKEASAAGVVGAAVTNDLLLLRAGLHLVRLDCTSAMRDLAAARGAAAGSAAWHLRMVHAALALEAPDAAERSAQLAATAARHDGHRVWAELLLLLLLQRRRGGDTAAAAAPPKRGAQQAELRAIAARRGTTQQALLLALLSLLQTEAAAGDAAESDEAEAELASCVEVMEAFTSSDSELGSAVLTTLALATVARSSRTAPADGGAGVGGGAAAAAAAASATSAAVAEVVGAKRKRTEDALMSALILAARMQDAHTQRMVLEELVSHHSPDDPAQADEYAHHLRAKEETIDRAVGDAKRTAAFGQLFG